MKARTCVCIPLPWREPLSAFAPLSTAPYALLLGPGYDHGKNGRWSIILVRPDEVFERSGPEALSALPPLPPIENARPLPFVGGYAGLASYELGAALDRVPRHGDGPWPDLAFGHYACAALFDHHTRSFFVVGPDKASANRFAEELAEAPLPPLNPKEKTAINFQLSRNQCMDQVQEVIRLIHAGDIFQANISQGFRIDLGDNHDAYSYYRRLCAQSPAPYGAFFRRTANQVLISNSPEQFFSLDEHGVVQTSPIKGTRPRAKDPQADQALARELLASPKDRSENLMIVDLMRNDLSRVCKAGSVKVSKHCALQSFANVHHLVSTVEGQLDHGKTAIDVLAACFPAGSITGAPKIRAMEIIARMEGTARGPYCGSLGYISAHGRAEFNVLIRSAEHTQDQDGNHLRFRTGGGIVADSDPAMEAQEMLDKARALARAAGAEI